MNVPDFKGHTYVVAPHNDFVRALEKLQSGETIDDVDSAENEMRSMNRGRYDDDTSPEYDVFRVVVTITQHL